MSSEGVPPFALHAQELLGRSFDPESGSSSLARVILKDVGLTSQILRTANSPFYNRSGRPIGSIAHAITMLGWETVRNLVGAMRFVEHYARHSPGLRELMMFSLLTATHGRQVANSVGYPRPEEAYLAGLLRNMGEVLLARFCGREYADMVLLMEHEHMPERAAAQRVFGFDPDDVARRLAEDWNLPAPLRCSLDRVAMTAAGDLRCLASVANFGHELTRSLYRRAQPLNTTWLKTVLSPSGTPHLIGPIELQRIVDCAVQDTAITFQALRIPVASLRLEEQADRAREILTGTEREPAGDATAAGETIAEAEARVETGDFDIAGLIGKVLDTLTRHSACSRALFALLSEDRTYVRARLASGPTAEQDLRLFRFSLLRADAALAAAIERKQDLWVDRSGDKRYEGSRIVAAFDPPQFALLPVIVDGVVAGVLYADGRGTGRDDFRPVMSRIRSVTASAIARKRLS